MPQAPRKDIATKAQDKESKRARGALSCAECRRLKLKCDKTVPCSSCKRRGCSAICPNGSLITGQGTRFVLADTEKLHQKIAHMSDRIRQLEDALAVLQSTVSGPSGDPHPLLHRDLLKIKSSIDLHSASDGASMFPSGSGTLEEATEGEEADETEHEPYIDAFGTLAIRDGGAATFYGRSAGSESLLIGEEHSTPDGFPSAASSYSDLHSNGSQQFDFEIQRTHHPSEPSGSSVLPQAIANLASLFPLAPSLSMSSTPTLASSSSVSSPSSLSYPYPLPFQGSITLQTLISQYLPPYPEAVRLTQLYLEQAPWFFGAVTGRELESEILPMWYREASSASTSTPPSLSALSKADGTAESGQQRVGTSHDLALLFVVFCFGNMADINLPAPPTNVPAEKFYHLTKAALTLDSASIVGNDTKAARNGLLDRPPSVATVQTLSLMAIYEGICSGENSIESTWTLMGLAGKLAQSIGLHRDCARWKLSTQEVQKRRALFWELFITDCWQSLATGRLATFSLPFVDCELPFDHDQIISDDGSIHPSFPFWKARFGAECVAAVVQGTLTSRAPRYSIILDLDRKVRDMDLPIYAQGVPPQGLGLAQTMSHFMPHNYRELTLLYIHRCFFAHALSSNPLDPIKSQYAPSFLAGYRSACTIVGSVKTQFTMFPKQIARFWVLWTHAFSASVMLASVVTHASRSKIAPAALLELKNACDLFQKASPYGGRAGKFLPILKRLQAKAQKVYRDANSGTPAPIPNDIFKPSQAKEANDELSIFSGKTHTVNTKTTASHGQSSTTTHSSTSSSSSTQGRSSSGSPSQVFTDNPSFAGVHSSLVSELNMFQGHIKEQIQNAYRAGGEVFGGGPMEIDSVPPPAPRQQHQARMVLQQERQQQQQHRYELEREREEAEQREMQRQQMERAEMERQEMERQEFDRQEMARMKQQQLETERQKQAQQQEVHRHQQEQQAQQARMQQQQFDAQRHQETLEQQRNQEHYHRQLEIQRQQQHQQQMPQYRSQPQYEREVQYQQPAYAVGPDRPDAAAVTHANAPVAQLSHQRNPSHPQPLTNLHHSYPQSHYQPMPHPHGPPHPHPQPMGPPPPPSHVYPPHLPQRHAHSEGAITPQHTGSAQHHSSQPPQYVLPRPQEYATPRSNASFIDYTPPTTSYGPTPRQDVPEAYKYWPAASGSFAMPVQQSSSSFAPPTGQHYTPEGALRGIAADDRSLQETWQSYMNNVGSPRQLFED